MGVSARYIMAAAALAFAPGAAFADCLACQGGSPTPSSPTVSAPSPLIVAPGFTSGATSEGHHGGCGPRCGPGLPGGPIVVAPTPYVPAPHVVITHGGFSHESTTLNINASIDARTFSYRGGGGLYASASPVGVDGGAGLAVGATMTRTRVETRVTEQMRAIQAICVDDRGAPHPASQTFGEEEVAEGFEGEIFRCIAGTKMRVTLGRYEEGTAHFENGASFDCEKGQALVYRDREIVCRTQQPQRQCNERSLLRRYGPGLKIVRIRFEEQVSIEEEVRHGMQTTAPTQMFDGGVGLSVW